MQALERDGLSAAQVTALLTGTYVQVSTGCDLLAPDLSFVEDISDDLVGGRVARNLFATIHGTLDIALSRELVWGNALVRPWMTLTNKTTSARFDLGVYVLTTPERRVGETPVTFDVQGYDRLYLLEREVGASYTVAAGVTYRAALLAVFTAAGLTGALIDGVAADSTVPVARAFPLVGSSSDPDQTDSPVTWLRIVNVLLEAINFRSVWCDERGVFRCHAYAEPSSRPTEFDLPADDEIATIVGDDRTVIADVYATPNRWVAIASNPPDGVVPSEANGLIQVRENLADGPTSQAERTPAVWPSVLSYEAATSAALAGLIDRRVASDRRTTVTVRMQTGTLPIAGHADIVALVDGAAGLFGRAQAIGWSLPLDGSDMDWTLEMIL